MPKSDIPMGSEFGPNQVVQGKVLELAQQHAGNEQEFVAAIAREYGWPFATAKNTRLSMRRYLLLDDQDQLTEVGQHLLDLRANQDELYADFARHILLHLRGLEVVNAIDTLIKTGEPVTQLTIAETLYAQGIYVSASSTHISKLCGWLRYSGIFRSEAKFDLDMDRVTQLIGATQVETDLLAEMPEDQRAVLKALCNLPMLVIPDQEPLLANKVMEYAETLYGVTFNPKNFPREVLEPLASAGYISIEKQAKATGEEARSRTQALAFYLMRLLGLEFKSWRKRGKKTGGFEVDVIVEGARLIFSRWQIQCKNTPESAVPLEDIAKEVGLSLQLKSNVILMVTTGRFSRDALIYTDDMMRLTHLNIVTLDKGDLRKLAESPLAIVEILNKKARRVMELKALSGS